MWQPLADALSYWDFSSWKAIVPYLVSIAYGAIGFYKEHRRVPRTMRESWEVLDASIVPGVILLAVTAGVFIAGPRLTSLTFDDGVWFGIGAIAVLVVVVLSPAVTPLHAVWHWLHGQQARPTRFAVRSEVVNGATLDIYFSSKQPSKNVSVEFLNIQKWRDGHWRDTQKFKPVAIDTVPDLLASKEASIKRALYGEMGWSEMTWFVRGSKVIVDEHGRWRMLVHLDGFDENKVPIPPEEVSIEFEIERRDGHLMLKH